MYKIKDVCNLTGLTEKTIRFYVEQKLITPQTESGLHYKSYRFTDADIQLLRDISALRSAEFTISEIRQMLADPNAIPVLVAEKESILTGKIAALQSIRHALKHLTVAEQTNLSQIADAIEPRSPLRKETPKNTHNRFLWLFFYIGLFTLLAFLVTGGDRPWLILFVAALLGGLEFPIMAMGYFRYNRRYRSLPRTAEAVIVSVISDEGIDGYWEESSWDALRGMIHFGFIHWNWIRPDHWVPLIQFEADGRTITTAYRYGGMKNSWKPGDVCMVAWEPGKEQQVYPCGDAVIRRKAWIYLLCGIALLAGFFGGIWLLSALQ